MAIKKRWVRNKNGSVRGPYLYEYRSIREGENVRTVYVRYMGRGVSAPREALRLERADPGSNLSRCLEGYASGKAVIAFDLETTGFSGEDDAPIEIAAVKVVVGSAGGQMLIMDRWSTLVNPGREIPGMIQKLTNITQDMVRDAPDVGTAYRAFREWTGSPRYQFWLGQNVDFDLRFVRRLDERYGFEGIPDTRVMDTLDLSRSLYPEAEHHTLKDIQRREQVRMSDVDAGDQEGGGQLHRATTDCEITARAWRSMSEKAKFLIEYGYPDSAVD